ncbi:hypothetical protein AUR67_00500 [Pseudoalteromonas sp. XI10]|uniref:hypothetical protein n=1 Tax=Pseudoalteromonas sp. XI10 TaxID=1766621 RepID=UPI0007335FF9|nr:hypothetical protein [Pseudoalteromonas sp. XI10]KTG21992.1 hypothetical protein AUR67_00500 [Pseudoalteromonas sp. XI10]
MNRFDNPEYDGDQVMQMIANESPLFSEILKGLVNDTDPEYPTNQAWLGTLNLNGTNTQIKLVVTQKTNSFIDEE